MPGSRFRRDKLPYPAFRRVNAEPGDGELPFCSAGVPTRVLAIERTNRGWGHPRYKAKGGRFANRPHDACGNGRFRAVLAQSTLCPPDYRPDQTGPPEFPICQVDKLDCEPDLMSLKGN
jgi:hypothetical protein